nr:MAG TPA: H-type lectin domain [Caudoviricetes sp.]
MTRPSTGGSGSGGDLDGGILHDGGAEDASFADYKESDSMRKTIKFPAPFTITPYIVISPTSSSNTSSQTSIPAAWYHDESATDFTAELYSAVKLTWIAIGNWK